MQDRVKEIFKKIEERIINKEAKTHICLPQVSSTVIVLKIDDLFVNVYVSHNKHENHCYIEAINNDYCSVEMTYSIGELASKEILKLIDKYNGKWIIN